MTTKKRPAIKKTANHTRKDSVTVFPQCGREISWQFRQRIIDRALHIANETETLSAFLAVGNTLQVIAVPNLIRDILPTHDNTPHPCTREFEGREVIECWTWRSEGWYLILCHPEFWIVRPEISSQHIKVWAIGAPSTSTGGSNE